MGARAAVYLFAGLLCLSIGLADSSVRAEEGSGGGGGESEGSSSDHHHSGRKSEGRRRIEKRDLDRADSRRINRSQRRGSRSYARTVRAGRAVRFASKAGIARRGAIANAAAMAASAKYLSQLLSTTNRQISKIEQDIANGAECSGSCAEKLSKLEEERTQLTASLDNQRKIQEKIGDAVSDLSTENSGSSADEAGLLNTTALASLGGGSPLPADGLHLMPDNAVAADGSPDEKNLGDDPAEGKTPMQLEIEKMQKEAAGEEARTELSGLNSKNSQIVEGELDQLLEREIPEFHEVETASDDGVSLTNLDLSGFLPKNDPRRDFASFSEGRDDARFDPTFTESMGPTLFEKLTRRYKAIEPLMTKK